MGNGTSKSNEEGNKLEPKPMSQILDYIATHYILTMDFKSLRKLYDKEYCDKLVILTSDIIERYYTDIEITYLSQRTKEGADINEKENVSVMLYSLRRTAEIINLNKQNKTLTFESKLEFAGELNDNIVILKNNKICLFGKITKIY